MTIRGWVYIIENISMPDILKIGYSTKDPMLRAKELAGTSTPHPFRVVFDVLVENPRLVEQSAHSALASKREGKEWFRCSHEEAIAVIRSCSETVLLERNNSSEIKSYTIEKISGEESQECWYYNCKKIGALSYKDHIYCEEHYKLLRKGRFDRARLLREG